MASLEWLNTPVSQRLRTIIFTPNAPVSKRWKVLVVSRSSVSRPTSARRGVEPPVLFAAHHLRTRILCVHVDSMDHTSRCCTRTPTTTGLGRASYELSFSPAPPTRGQGLRLRLPHPLHMSAPATSRVLDPPVFRPSVSIALVLSRLQLVSPDIIYAWLRSYPSRLTLITSLPPILVCCT